jgi:dethiobiotin synthetase
MAKGLFVTGTDTDVGKTVVSCGVVSLLKSWGAKVGAMKPIATGNREDARRLKEAAGMDDPLDLINPQFFKAPLAPAVSAALEERRVDMEAIYKAYWVLQKKYDILIVEGVGGVKVPLSDSTYVIDLMQALRLPVLVVAHARLGTLNQTLLTLDALAAGRLSLLGVLLNGNQGKTLAEKTNADVLQDYTVMDVFGALKANPAMAKSASKTAAALSRLPLFNDALRRLFGLDERAR